MGVYYSLVYGVALTDQFGGKLKHIPEALFDFGVEEEATEKSKVIHAMPTSEDYFLALGVTVSEGSEAGVTWVEGNDALKAIHEQYLKVLELCPETVRNLISEHALVPRLCVLAGDF